MAAKSKSPNSSDSRVLLRRFVYALGTAQTDFRAALYGCEQILEHASQPEYQDTEIQALQQGTFIVYSRPFMGVSAVGSLPPEWGKFDDEDLTVTHHVVIDNWKRVVAEGSISGRHLMAYAHSPKVRMTVVNIVMAPHFFSRLKNCCEIQLRRIEAVLPEKMAALLDGRADPTEGIQVSLEDEAVVEYPWDGIREPKKTRV